ncbi:MCE family protein [Mycolicibacterium sp. A43C]
MSRHTQYSGARELHPAWWSAVIILALAAMMGTCIAFFAGVFRSSIPVTLTSDRSGLVMESGARVTMRGVEVGRVAGVRGGSGQVSLDMEIFTGQTRFIPANVLAEIKATTAFGAKYVELRLPEDPASERISAGAVLHSQNVTTEVNTVFQNLVGLLDKIDVAKLNSTLSALAEGVRGQGERMGQATTAANHVLQEINPRMDTIAANWRSLAGFSDAYASAAADILTTLDAAATTATTIADRSTDLDALLLSTIGFAGSANELFGSTRDDLVTAVNDLEPTTALLLKYQPVYTCLLKGAKFFLDNGGYAAIGGNGRSFVQDVGLGLGEDAYHFPDNLPLVAAKGGPGGRPGCGSLPDVAKFFPVQYQVTNTGWGTGLDQRPNPGLPRECFADYLPVTRAVPEPPSIRRCLSAPAPGPVVPPGMPPYGAPWYGPDGTPLFPGVPPAPPPQPVSAAPNAPAQEP